MDGINPVNPLPPVNVSNNNQSDDTNQILLDKAKSGIDKSGAALDKVALIIEQNTKTALDLLI